MQGGAYKKAGLLLISIVSIVLYFLIPLYTDWLKVRIFNPGASFLWQVQHLDVEGRRINRYGDSYVNFKRVEKIIRDAAIPNPVILLPPNQFLKDNHSLLTSVEPAEFYYFTGIRAVIASSPDLREANLSLTLRDSTKFAVTRILNASEFIRFLNLYKPYMNNQ